MASVALGKITVAVAGTPVQVLATNKPCNAIYFEQISGQTGKIYIMDRSTGNKTTLVGVLKVLLVPTSTFLPNWTVGLPSTQNGLNVANFWIDADTSNESALVTYLEL